jgi:catechol 2,3-dioxygenase-like lactoylglutathione lyase family enzyme
VSARLAAITAFRLTTEAPERLALFYAGLGFDIGKPVDIPAEEIALLGLQGRGTRLSMRIGHQRVDLDHFEQAGRPYPMSSTAADLCFQHFALVTDDAGAAWTCARSLGARSISTEGPVMLPAESGGVTAIKFRDPEGHPLEFLQFPSGTDTNWRGKGVLGIDHSAISVADTAVSRAFYEALCLVDRGATVNRGPAQDRLDGLRDVIVDVVPLLPLEISPHLELLGYRAPIGRPSRASAPNDIAATRSVWAADCDALLHDPDGHLHLFRK